MKTLDTHGLKIDLDSLKEASDYTAGSYADRGHVDIFYDRITGKVWGVFNTRGNWTEYRMYPEIIQVGGTLGKRSQQAILDMIDETISEMKYAAEQLGEEYTDTFI